MFFFSQIISYILFNLGYLIITPKTYSFGGFYHTIIYGLKLSRLKNKKSLFAISLINLQDSSLKIYHADILIKIFKSYSLIEKILCLILSLYINLNNIVLLLLRKILFSKYNSKYIHLIFSDYIGYADRKNKLDYFLRKLDLNYSELVSNKLDLSSLYKNQNAKSVCFSIKDDNYSKIKEISSHLISNINNCKKSLNFLLNEDLKVSRVGESLMNKFNFKNKNYHDLCYEKNHNELLNETYANSKFYFGSSGSLGLAAEVFNKKKFIINEICHLEANQSADFNNFIIFKKIVCVKSKKIIKLSELFEKKLFYMSDILEGMKDNLIYLEENSEDDIFDGLVEFYEHNFKNKKINLLLNNKYQEIRNDYINKFYNTPADSHFKNHLFTIPDFYLSKYLM